MKKLLFICIVWFLIINYNITFSSTEQNENFDVLVVEGSQSGVMAAIQAARMGSKVALVSKSVWLGGSAVKAGVSAIDGNELLAFQTGLWGEFLAKIAEKNSNILKYGWVSLFTFNPQKGQEVLQSWIKSEKNIIWFPNQKAIEVLSENNQNNKKVLGVKFQDNKNNILNIKAKITIDATELGDLLALGNIEHRIGWEYSQQYQENSAPKNNTWLKKRYPVQELTWVFYLKDFGIDKQGPEIPKPVAYTYEKAAKMFWCAFDNKKLKQSNNRDKWLYKYNSTKDYFRVFAINSFITYGQISPNLFMINWPKCGNDYSQHIERIFDKNLKTSEEFYKEARTHSLWFARYLQDTLGKRFGLANDIFPPNSENNFIEGFANVPYYREARRMWGYETFVENDFLPKTNQKAVLQKNSIAIGNYVNDHHYWELAKPESIYNFKLAPKSLKWGGRYTGTPFSISYNSLIPIKTDGFLIAEKSFSISHIANGVTRLQPVCMLIGQATGAIAALAAQKNIQPSGLNVQEVQSILLNDPKAPPTVVPLFDVNPDNSYRASIQRLILSGIIDFPLDGEFHPKEKASLIEIQQWCKKANISCQTEWSNLNRDELSHKIEKQALVLSKIPPNDHSGQSLVDFPVQKYCGQLVRKPNDSYSIEYAKDSQNNKLERISPFETNFVNSSGAITFSSDVYKNWQLLQENEKKNICFLGQFNHSGSWFIVTKMLSIP